MFFCYCLNFICDYNKLIISFIKMKKYEWGVIGGGIAGIAISEILTREGHSVVLLEKNPQLATVTTREFHEWIHTGALYTLIPDKLMTLKFILGAIDDLIEYYSVFDRMNLVPTASGLNINNKIEGWFNPNYIHFKYRIKGRKLTFPWLIGVARSVNLINKIHDHDWLRRRAGELEPFNKDYYNNLLKIIGILFRHNENFFEVKTPDFTTNSRLLLRDMFTTAIHNGLVVSTNNEIKKIRKNKNALIIDGKNESFEVKNIAICAGKNVAKFSNAKIKTSYAPIAVVDNCENNAKSFVELDYFPKNCINMLTKENNIALIGGISLNNKEKCDKYLDYVIDEHKKLNPDLRVLNKYLGEKNEITFKGQDRNYLYHIYHHEELKNVWSIIPGKFTLAFSLAPEFYRTIYLRNPKKAFQTSVDNGKYANLIANTLWYDEKMVSIESLSQEYK